MMFTASTQKIEEALATLVPGTDFGSIAGIKGNVLFKPALVKILRHLGYKYNTKLVDKQLASGILAYTVEVTVINSEGEFVCSALGSSNSGEKKFADISITGTTCYKYVTSMLQVEFKTNSISR